MPTLLPITLDDGQIISGPLNKLTQTQIISLANQHRKNKNYDVANAFMEYQHRKFYEK